MQLQCAHDSLIHFLLRFLPLGGISLHYKNCKGVYEAISVMQKTVCKSGYIHDLFSNSHAHFHEGI